MRYTSARQVWHDCYTLADKTPGGKHLDPNHRRLNIYTQKAAVTITAQATPPKKGSRAINIPESFELVKAHQIIKKMPALLRAWGMFVYTSQFTKAQHQMILNDVYEWWHGQNGHNFEGNAVKTARHLALVQRSVDDMKLRLSTSGRSKYIASEYCHDLGIQQANWARDGWDTSVSQLHHHIDQIDRKALGPIAQMLNEREPEQEEI